MSFGEKIKQMRREKGLTQIEVAKMIGNETRGYITDVEKDKFIPQPDKIAKLALALEAPKEEIEELVIEAKLEKLGLTDPTATLMMKEVPKMTLEEKQSIVKAYEAVLEARKEKRKK